MKTIFMPGMLWVAEAKQAFAVFKERGEEFETLDWDEGRDLLQKVFGSEPRSMPCVIITDDRGHDVIRSLVGSQVQWQSLRELLDWKAEEEKGESEEVAR